MAFASWTTHGLSTRRSRKVTSTISPVSPMPPTVARNSSRSWDGPQTSRLPSAVRSRKRSTNLPKDPSR